MKAKEYYEKYSDLIENPDNVLELIKEFNQEMGTMIADRGIKTDSAAVALIKQMNQKWNALASIYEKETGVKILLRNGFISYWSTKVEIDDYEKRYLPRL